MHDVDDDDITFAARAFLGDLVIREHVDGFIGESGEAPHARLAQGSVLSHSASLPEAIDDLARVIHWHEQGLLTDTEFQAAKRRALAM